MVKCTAAIFFLMVDFLMVDFSYGGLCKTRAVTNFSSRRGIVKSSRGTKNVWCAAAEGGVWWRLRV